MPNVIRLGDATSHGGKVIAVVANHYTIGGIAVACVGDLCSCPLPGHGQCTIAQGNPHHTVNGKQVAYASHKTSCGAELIASQAVFSTQ